MFESLLPLALAWLVASYNRQWLLVYNLFALWFFLVLNYFAIDFSKEDINPPEQYIESNYERRIRIRVPWKPSKLLDLWLPYGFMFAFPLTQFYFYRNVAQMCHYFSVLFFFKRLVNVFPKSFTFSEAFNFVAISSYYVYFGMKHLKPALLDEKVYSLAGNGQFNAIIFMPWVCLFLLASMILIQTLWMKV